MSPLRSNVSVCGSRASGVGIMNFSIAPVSGFEPADVHRAVAGVPHEPVVVDDQVVRARARIELVAPEVAGCRVEIGEVVAPLPDEPDASLARRRKGRAAWCSPRVRPTP